MEQSNFSIVIFPIPHPLIWDLNTNSVHSTHLVMRRLFPIWEGASLLIREVARVLHLFRLMSYLILDWCSICLFEGIRFVIFLPIVVFLFVHKNSNLFIVF